MSVINKTKQKHSAAWAESKCHILLTQIWKKKTKRKSKFDHVQDRNRKQKHTNTHPTISVLTHSNIFPYEIFVPTHYYTLLAITLKSIPLSCSTFSFVNTSAWTWTGTWKEISNISQTNKQTNKTSSQGKTWSDGQIADIMERSLTVRRQQHYCTS